MWGLELKKYKVLKQIKKMPVFVFLLVVTLFFTSAKEVQSVVWLDSNHNETSSKEAMYYRPKPKKKRNSYYIVDFYKNGSKYREGYGKFTKPNNEEYSGIVTYYYENGSVSKKVKYKKGTKEGDYFEYFESGDVKVIGKYENDLEEGTWKFMHKGGKIRMKGKYREGEKVGVWKTFYKNVYYPDNE